MKTNWKKIGLYLVIACGISWVLSLLMVVFNIKLSSILGISLVALFYMGGPAIATFVIQKFIYKERFKQYGWNFEKKKWKSLLLIPLIYILFIGIIFLVIAIFGNLFSLKEFGSVDFSTEGFNARLAELLKEKSGGKSVHMPSISPVVMLVISLFQAMLFGATVNVPFMFGEEFGWRGLLLKETQHWGFLKSNVFIGLVWGFWHWPLILLGHNYPHYPYIGILMMCLFTLALAPLFSYVRFKSKTILAPCILHGMINGTASLFLIYIANGNELVGSIAGGAGVIAGVLVTICICMFDRSFIRNYKNIE